MFFGWLANSPAEINKMLHTPANIGANAQPVEWAAKLSEHQGSLL